ncbi:MAG TPA: DUF1566 domain-containing protein [bacterium]|nr:DUF1566 domain-containing protein [bacterium]
MRFFRFLLISLSVPFFVLSCVTDENDILMDDENVISDKEENKNDEENQLLCGNKTVDSGEICDGGAKECLEIDSQYSGGIATCNSTCDGWITSDCKQNTGDTGDTGNSGNTGDSGDSGDSGTDSFDKNAPGIWVDPETFLIWENPMGNKGAGGLGPKHAEALKYCENLVLAGATDWRLPTISELRTITRGVSTVMTGGKCPTTDTCTDQDTCNKDKENTQGFGNSCLGCYALDETKYDPDLAYLTDDDCKLTERQLDNEECYIVPILHGPCNGTWSNTPNTSAAGTMASAYWYLNFKGGLINSDADSLSGANWVRCVRAGTADDVPENDYVPQNPYGNCYFDSECEEGKWCENNNCVIIPAATFVDTNGLEWQAGKVETNTWQESLDYCEALDFAGFSDWRLPNIDELKSLVKGCAKTTACTVTSSCTGYTACNGGSSDCKTGCANGNYLPAEVGQQNLMYWTSDEEAQATTNAWLVSFSTGSVSYMKKTWDNQLARCVRGTKN